MEVTFDLQHENSRFYYACRQLALLNTYIEELQARYERATPRQKAFRYNLRLRLAVFEGLRHVMYEWASQKADDLDELEAARRDNSS